jgi:hypothetical protein
MPIRLPPRGDDKGIYWNAGAGIQRVEHSSVQGQPGTKKHREGMQAAVQAGLDSRIKLLDFPADDPARLSDPDDNPKLTGRMFWGDADGKKNALLPASDTWVTSRAVVVTIQSWDGTAYYCKPRRA